MKDFTFSFTSFWFWLEYPPTSERAENLTLDMFTYHFLSCQQWVKCLCYDIRSHWLLWRHHMTVGWPALPFWGQHSWCAQLKGGNSLVSEFFGPWRLGVKQRHHDRRSHWSKVAPFLSWEVGHTGRAVLCRVTPSKPHVSPRPCLLLTHSSVGRSAGA